MLSRETDAATNRFSLKLGCDIPTANPTTSGVTNGIHGKLCGKKVCRSLNTSTSATPIAPITAIPRLSLTNRSNFTLRLRSDQRKLPLERDSQRLSTKLRFYLEREFAKRGQPPLTGVKLR